MLIQPYQTDELNFAWCYRVFFRWRTWRRDPVPFLAGLTPESLNPRLEQYHVRLLEFGSDTIDIRAIDIRAIVSLRPQESTASGVGPKPNNPLGKPAGFPRGETSFRKANCVDTNGSTQIENTTAQLL